MKTITLILFMFAATGCKHLATHDEVVAYVTRARCISDAGLKADREFTLQCLPSGSAVERLSKLVECPASLLVADQLTLDLEACQ
jgi:hypothetical protein